MTRINVVPVETLTDKHLLAEYKEITRPFNKVIKRLEAGTYKDVVIPDKYCLGKGHETFFFDKLGWLHKRYTIIYNELLRRGVNVDFNKFSEVRSVIYDTLHATKSWGQYTPTPEDMYLNMARLAKRSNIDCVLDELKHVDPEKNTKNVARNIYDDKADEAHQEYINELNSDN